MSNIRDIKRKARLDLHARAKIEALYVSADLTSAVEITCRLHTKVEAVAMDGGNSSTAGNLGSRKETVPKILFMNDELAEAGITLQRGTYISVGPGEAYALDHAEPTDFISVTWYVTPLSAKEAAGMPVPVTCDG